MPKQFELDNGSLWKPSRVERPFVLTDAQGRAEWIYLAVADKGGTGNIAVPLQSKGAMYMKLEGTVALKAGLPLGTPGKAQALPAASRASLEDHTARVHLFADPDWFQWGGSVVQGEDGQYHMFYARWRRDNPRGMRGWLYESQIAHATAEKPEGPYAYQSVVLKGFGQPQAERWDAINAHNPCITRMTDPDTGRERYYLYYIANRDDNQFTKDGKENDWLDHITNQRVGLAVADSPDGPWVRHSEPVITPPNGPLHHYLVNPGVCQLPDGRYLMVLKGRGGKGNPFGPMLHGWALADRPEGPFAVQEALLFPANIHAEDPCVWVEGDWIFAAVKDWSGQLSGTKGISYVRGRLKGDNLLWEVPKNNSISPRALLWTDGQRTNLAHLERPFILRNSKGVPTHLFAACSVKNPFAKAHSKPSLHLPFNACLPLPPANSSE